ncbi:hypothetical protein [Tenacibaculum maritimum]|uniref:hypothetical protein n=1 Tax=Tenacibaculum maritimum TaxID=107401 RepID=UPI001E3BD268|nr:hypothetical protein [Tenacibaculum maritimum]MCD9586045.1 hypothetical protein [Tenacibaculum maritimum]MCD9622018.1 hypothetical protein [Tenacibaculum maritimum]MCD9628385.1 hypothetical protein [Tenacibaculum maritimum]MCD9631206.1 hypothetical protein [Tenacibaculum maritimum]MCD9634119.1 hypothetical protein [Tenacibaculum maritimum]
MYELLSPQVELITEFDRTKVILTEGNEDYPPHFDDDFVNEINERFMNHYKDRVLKKVIYPDNELIKSMIIDLEKNVC